MTLANNKCDVCGERNAIIQGKCGVCIDDSKSKMTVPNLGGKPTIEAHQVSPTFAKLEAATSGWLYSGAGSLVIGLIIASSGLSDSYSPEFNPLGLFLAAVGAIALNVGVLMFVASKHAKSQIETAIYLAGISK